MVKLLHSLQELGGAGEALYRDDWKAAEKFHEKSACPSISCTCPKVPQVSSFGQASSKSIFYLPLLLACGDDTLISVVRNSDNSGMSSRQSPGGNDSLHLQRRVR